MRRFLPLVVVETSTALSGVANGISMIAFPWLVLELTGRATAAAAIGAITALPLAASFLFSGVIVDLVGRRRVAVVSDVLSMVSVALVPILGATMGLSFWLLAALAVLGATFDPAGISGREAMLPEVAESTGLRRERVNGIHEATWGVAYLLGPGIGGLSLGLLGGPTTFWISTAMFAVSAVVILAARFPGTGRPTPEERPGGVLAGAREGIGYVWRDRTLRTMALVGMVVVGFWLPVEGVVLPAYFQATDQPERLGLAITAMGVGGLIGALVYSATGHRGSQRRIFTLCLIGAGVGALGMAFLPAYPLLLAFGFVAGLAYGPVGPVEQLTLQNRTPFRLRGRVTALLASAAYAAGPLGYVVIGPAIDLFGLRAAFLLVSVLVLLVGLSTLFLPSLRALDDPPLPGSGPGGQPSPTRTVDADS